MKTTARFITEVTVTDPDSKGEVGMSVFKHDQGQGMFAIDSSFLDQCFDDDEDPVIDDPFNKGREIILHGV